jgi:hypothetical protein
MNNKDILKQYVNSGNLLPEYQVKKLNSGLLKSYLRKRLQNKDILEEYEFFLLPEDWLNKVIVNDKLGIEQFIYLLTNGEEPEKIIHRYRENGKLFLEVMSNFDKYKILIKSKHPAILYKTLGDFDKDYIKTKDIDYALYSTNPIEISNIFKEYFINNIFPENKLKNIIIQQCKNGFIKYIENTIIIINNLYTDYFHNLSKSDCFDILKIGGYYYITHMLADIGETRMQEIISNLNITDLHLLFNYYDSNNVKFIEWLLDYHYFRENLTKDKFDYLKKYYTRGIEYFNRKYKRKFTQYYE